MSGVIHLLNVHQEMLWGQGILKERWQKHLQVALKAERNFFIPYNWRDRFHVVEGSLVGPW